MIQDLSESGQEPELSLNQVLSQVSHPQILLRVLRLLFIIEESWEFQGNMQGHAIHLLF